MFQIQVILFLGSIVRVKRTFFNKMLIDIIVKSIGIFYYYLYILKVFDFMFRVLDL